MKNYENADGITTVTAEEPLVVRICQKKIMET